MKAVIDNNLIEIKIINPHYNDHAVEVEMLSGTWGGYRCIVEKSNLRDNPKPIKLRMSSVEFIKGTEYDFGEFRTIWGATIYDAESAMRIELAWGCKTKAEAMTEARRELNKLNKARI